MQASTAFHAKCLSLDPSISVSLVFSRHVFCSASLPIPSGLAIRPSSRPTVSCSRKLLSSCPKSQASPECSRQVKVPVRRLHTSIGLRILPARNGRSARRGSISQQTSQAHDKMRVDKTNVKDSRPIFREFREPLPHLHLQYVRAGLPSREGL